MKTTNNVPTGRRGPSSRARGLVIGVTAAVALLASSTSASAASTLYAPEQGARTFANGPAGWTDETTSEGVCVELVLCPQITNSYEPSDGADENGFLRTEIGSLTGAGGTSTGTWASPTFVYDGNDGVRPDSLELSLARRADVNDLLRVDDNTAAFTVNLVSISSPADTVTVIDERSLEGADDWSRIRDVAIDPTQLKVGDEYRLEIATTYRTGLTVVPGGSADYDDVVLRAKGVAAGADGSNGANGQNGSGAAGGGAGGGAANALAGSGIAGKAATLDRKSGRLLVKVRCAKKAASACKMKVAGQLKKRGGKVGKASKVKVRAGKTKKVALKVKAGVRPKLENRKRIFVRQRVSIGGKSNTKVVKLKLRHG